MDARMGQPSDTNYDVIIIGGGPAGATSGLVLARENVRTLILEKSRFPRFHIGESFLPRTFELIRELGLLPDIKRMPNVAKFGAEFGMGNSLDTTRFSFDIGLIGGENETFNIERAMFDNFLLCAARDAGAEVVQETGVKRILRLADGDVEIEIDGGARLKAKYLFDASGQSCVVGKHLGTRKVFPHHRKVAFFNHFTNVKRLSGREEGYATVAMCDEGWFWIIPIDAVRTSIGLVMDADAARSVNVPANQMLRWGITRCPLVADRVEHADFPDGNYVNADFSYSCAPYAGPGYFLVGDSAIFLDPIFSTGVCLGMMGGTEAGRNVAAVLCGSLKPREARRRHIRLVTAGSSTFFKLVNAYYRHSFRELFLHGYGPLHIHRAVISVLAGHIFPKPAFSLRWRSRLFEGLIALNSRISLVPRRRRFSLLASHPVAALASRSAPVGDLRAQRDVRITPGEPANHDGKGSMAAAAADG